MGENSKIEWTDHTFNPWWGCTKIAAGCTNCYAEALSKRTGRAKWGEQGTRQITSPANWRDPIKWNQAAAEAGERNRVFCASMADVFEDWSGPIMSFGRQPIYLNKQLRASGGEADRASLNDVRHRLFELIDQTPHLDWLLLTKRPENIRRMFPGVCGAKDDVCGDDGQTYTIGRHNVWLGTSIATQADADRNIPLLLECRSLAPVLFLSCEPLVEAVKLNLDGIGWVIVGGESGHGARPMHPEWVRSICDQCKAAGVPFFFKQWGEWREADIKTPQEFMEMKKKTWTWLDRNGESGFTFGTEGRACMEHVGKKAAGRLLDGVEYSEFPVAVTQ